jgi:hypothetical protein
VDHRSPEYLYSEDGRMLPRVIPASKPYQQLYGE